MNGSLIAAAGRVGPAARAGRTVHGRLRRRWLLNALVDPDEAARRLPPGLRPHTTARGTVVGCCVLELTDVRPAGLPAAVGRHLVVAAHRISAEWDDPTGARTVGVYVPMRHTGSPLAVVLGGRWFPGSHQRASIRIDSDHDEQSTDIVGHGHGFRLDAQVDARPSPGPVSDEATEIVGRVCLGATLGMSPDRRGRLEAVRMGLSAPDAQPLECQHLSSDFLDTFTTARPAPAFVMRDLDVTWRPGAVGR